MFLNNIRVQGSSYKTIFYFFSSIVFLSTIITFYAYLNFKGFISFIIVSILFYLIVKKRFKDSIDIAFFSYLFISLIGILYITNYSIAYHSTFGPYFDDSYYYNNALNISKLKISSLNITLYELLLAIPIFIIRLVSAYTLEHIDLIPLNWGIAALSVVLTCNLSKKIVSQNITILSIFSLLLNHNFIDSVSHLYRDCLIILLSLICISYILNQKYKKGIIFISIIFFIRGANSFLLLFFLLIHYLINIRKFKIKSIILFSVIGVILVFILSNYVSSAILRGGVFSAGEETIAQALTNRLENANTNESGILKLKNGTVIERVIYPIIYLFTPLNFHGFDTNVSIIRADLDYPMGFNYGVLNFVDFSSIMVLIHIILMAIIIPRIIFGCYFAYKKSSTDIQVLLLFFIITLISISFISMQARHKTAFIIFYPLWINLYNKKSSEKFKKINYIISLFILFILIISNTLWQIL